MDPGPTFQQFQLKLPPFWPADLSTAALEQRKLQQLLTSEELGNWKPMQLLRCMQHLLVDRAADGTFLREPHHQILVGTSDIPRTAVTKPRSAFSSSMHAFWAEECCFQHFMDKVLQGLDFCYVYIDDLQRCTSDPCIRLVLERHGILINPQKLVHIQCELPELPRTSC